MTDFGELVDVEVLVDRHDEDCYFCNYKEEIEERDNDCDDDFDEDAHVGVVADGKGLKHKNDSGKLGTNCSTTEPDELWVEGDDLPISLPVCFAAHHIIPGNGSLKISKLFGDDEIGIKIKGKAKGNVGYDVNNAVNGVWLPGNYAFSTIKPDPKKKGSLWGTKGGGLTEYFGIDEPLSYASAAIEFSGHQFHDAHEDYNSKIVLKALNAIYNKLRKTKKVPWCPNAPKHDAKTAPLYDLVNRLASLSLRLHKMLAFPAKNWKVNVFTSDFSRQWMESQKSSRRRWSSPRRPKG